MENLQKDKEEEETVILKEWERI